MRLNGYIVVLNVLLLFLFQHARGGQNCPRPKIANGQVKVRGRGKMVYYSCRKSFTRVGAKFAVCLSHGVWSQPPPICIGKGCPAVTPTNGLQVIGEHNGAMLRFTCPVGMKRRGPESIYCNGQTWDVEPPTCVVGISLQCDFEDEELCGWGQSHDDHFEWTWFSGATPTTNTGPLHDHTFGNNSKGHYLFIESSAPRKPLDKAILNSPLYQAQHSGSCFEFWYHMQGPDDANAVGSLEVFVKPESKLLDDIDPEFYMDGNQGPEWKRGSIKIEQQTEIFQIIIIATRKEAFVSDIAIDDVRMYNCPADDNAFLRTGEVTSEAVPATSKIITSQKISILTSTIKQSTTTTEVTKSSTTTPKTKRTTRLPTTTTALPTRTTSLTATTTTVLTATTTTTPKPKTRKRTITPGTVTTTKSTTVKTSTKHPETSMKLDSQTTLPLTPSTNKISNSTLVSNGLSNAPTALKLAIHTTTTISTAKEKPTFTNNFVTGNSHHVSETGSGNIGGDNSISSTSNRSQIIPPVSPIKAKTKDSLMPLIIGISCGVVLGLVVIGVAVYLWAKRQQNKTTEEWEEEMAPIACAEGGYYNPS